MMIGGEELNVSSTKRKPRIKAKVEQIEDEESDEEESEEAEIGEIGEGNDSIKLRKNFNMLAHFSTNLINNDEGEIKVPISVSDSLSKFKVFAIGAGINKDWGVAEDEIKTTQPFTIRSNLPNALYLHDEFQLFINIENKYEHSTISLAIICENNHIRIMHSSITERDDPYQFGEKIEFKKDERKVLKYRMKAMGRGEEAVRIIATSNGYSDALEGRIIISSIRTVNIISFSGILDPSNRFLHKVIQLHGENGEKETEKEGKMKIILSSGLLVEKRIQPIIHTIFKEGSKLSYGIKPLCGSAIVLLRFYKELKAMSIQGKLQQDAASNASSNISISQIDHKLRTISQEMERYVSLASYRSYRLYCSLDDNYSFLFVLYTSSLFLQSHPPLFQDKQPFQAQRRDISRFLKWLKGAGNMKNIQQTHRNHPNHYKNIYYCFFALLVESQLALSCKKRIKEDLKVLLKLYTIDQLPVDCIAFILIIIHSFHSSSPSSLFTSIKNQLINYLADLFYLLSDTFGYFHSYCPQHLQYQLSYSPIQSTAMLTYALLLSDKHHRFISQLMPTLFDFMENNSSDLSTQSSWCTIATSEYYHSFSSPPPSSSLSSNIPNHSNYLWINNQFLGEFKIAPGEEWKQLSVPLSKLSSNQSHSSSSSSCEYDVMILNNSPASPIHYLVDFTYPINANLDKLANGIEIGRDYEVINNTSHFDVLNDNHFAIKKGTRIKINLSIRIPVKSNHIVINDYLPAGFLIENSLTKPLPTIQATQTNNYDVEQDPSSTITQLPTEILFSIFSCLNTAEDLFSVQAVCRRWYLIISDDYFWENATNKMHVKTRIERKWWMSAKDYYLLASGKTTLKNASSMAKHRADVVVNDCWYTHSNLRSEGAEIFCNSLAPSTYLFSYTARANLVGTFTAPPAKTKLTFLPGIRANTTPFQFTIF